MGAVEIGLSILGIVVTVLIALVKGLHSGIKENRDKHGDLAKDHGEFKTHVAENYVEKDDLHRTLADIKGMIQRLFDKIDNVGKN